MAETNLNNQNAIVDAGKDSVTIIEHIEGIPGGRSLDVTGFTPSVIQAGHVVIKETDTGKFKPMPITGDGSIVTLGTLTKGSSYVAGTYKNKELSGGSGTGAVATIVVDDDGKVKSVTITTDGKGYVVGDELTTANTNLGGAGSGFKVAVASIDETKDEYDSLPNGHTIEGVVVASVTTDKAMVGIMVRGSVNEATSPYPVTADIKTALPLIRFTKD